MSRPQSPPDSDPTPSDQPPVLRQVWAIAWPVVAASMLDLAGAPHGISTPKDHHVPLPTTSVRDLLLI